MAVGGGGFLCRGVKVGRGERGVDVTFHRLLEKGVAQEDQSVRVAPQEVLNASPL